MTIRLRSGREILRYQQLSQSGDIGAVDGGAVGAVSGCALRYGTDIDRGWYSLWFEPGSFAEQLARFGGMPMLWQHQDSSPIGTIDGLADADPDQVRFTGQILDSEWVPDAKRAIALLAAKVMRQVSAGVTLLTWVEETDTQSGVQRIRISKAVFREISPVTFGALGDDATVDGQGLARAPGPDVAASVHRIRAELARLTA
jgi:HK97 family phage prohead protease